MATGENDYDARRARVVRMLFRPRSYVRIRTVPRVPAPREIMYAFWMRLAKKRGLERKGVRRRETKRTWLAMAVAAHHAAYVPVVKGRVRGFIDGVGTVAVYIIVSVILLSLWLGLWQPVDSQ